MNGLCAIAAGGCPTIVGAHCQVVLQKVCKVRASPEEETMALSIRGATYALGSANSAHRGPRHEDMTCPSGLGSTGITRRQ